MLSKGIPTHLITIVQKIYMESLIRVNAGNGISEDYRAVTQGVRQGCPLSPVLFNLYFDEVIRIWLQKIKTSKYFKALIFKSLLFADEQFIISDTEDNLQKAVHLLYNISKEYNLEILGGSLPLLSPAFRCSHFSRQVPPSATMRENLAAKGGTVGEKDVR